MNLIKWMLINLVLLLVTTSVWGLTGARLIRLSSSGQTALFNMGIHDGVGEGDYALIAKEIRDLNRKDLRVVPVAKAKNVKINTLNSVWILYEIFDSELLVLGQKFLILSESHVLSGRRDPKMGRVNIVTTKGKTSEQVKSFLQEDKDRISKLKTQYPEVEPLHGKESRFDKDVELIDVDRWKKIQGENRRSAIYRSAHQDDFKQKLRLETFEKLVTAYVKKVNEPDFSYEKFYEEQKKELFSDKFRAKMTTPNEYDDYSNSQKVTSKENAKLYKSLLEKGKTWSEDFSDEELGLVLKQVSELKEKERRIFVASEPKKYAFHFGYGLSLNDEQTDSDSRRPSGRSVDLDLEGIPLLKHPTLEKFTLNGTLRINNTAFESSGYNSELNELSVTAGANWYPFTRPYDIETLVTFFSLYLRTGNATAKTPTTGQSSKYTLLSFPGLRGGFKYNLKNNFGLRLALSMETLKLDRYEQSQLGSSLPDQVSIFESKVNFALTYSF